MKKWLVCCISVFMLLTSILPAKKTMAEEMTTCEDVIQDIVLAMNNRDWDTYLSHLEESKKVQMRDHYFAELTEESTGINQVIGAELKDFYLVDYADLYPHISYESYDIYQEVGDENIFGYLLEIDYDVSIENQYFYQGLNYNLWIFAFDGTDYKLVQFTIPTVDLVKKYISEKITRNELSEEDQKALYAAECRAHGNPVNLEGVSLWNATVPNSEENEETNNTDRVASQDTVPSSIKILWRTQEGGDNQIYHKNFREYCKQVLPHEWFASWDNNALFVGAKCVKTFSWYYCCYPHAADRSYDVNSIQQAWKPSFETHTATNDAINMFFRSGMFNSSGKLFPAYYRRGTAGQAGTKGQGYVSQYGSQYLAQQGWTSTQILNYYYEGSSASSGEVQFKTVNEY